MDCAHCRTPNDAPRRFCRQCGEPLGELCPRCKFFNGTGDRFCGGCGYALEAAGEAGSDQPPPAQASAPPAAPSERRLGEDDETTPRPDLPPKVSQKDIDKLFKR